MIQHGTAYNMLNKSTIKKKPMASREILFAEYDIR